MVEANAAIDYWGQWEFSARHRPRGWPPSWEKFTNRGSLIARGSPRHATHPVNVILNYAYGIAAGMSVRSLVSAGLDASVGFLHSDLDGRYSLAYDLLELLRPEIDAAIMPWISGHRWSRADFPTTRSGLVQLQPALARVVVERTVAAVPAARTEQAAGWLRDMIVAQPPG